MGQSLNHGKTSAVPLVAGVLSGDIIAMAVSFAGLGALLATSATLFGIFKWIAAAYLFYLGIKAWRSKVSTGTLEAGSVEKAKMFKEALVVTALNPKGIIFFIAFFPLFIDATKPALQQMLIMATTFLFVSAFSASFYSIFSGLLRSKVKSKKFQSVFNKISGTMLVGAGSITATLQK